MLSDNGELDTYKAQWPKIGVRRTYQTEYGPNCPTSIDASDADNDLQRVYLITGNDVFVYEITGTAPDTIVHNYLHTFTFTEETNNPFWPVSGSLPSLPTAMASTAGFVFVETCDELYTFDKNAQLWNHKGTINC